MVGGIIEVIKLINKILDNAAFIAKFVKDNKNEQWFQDSAAAFSSLRNAKTDEEKKDVAKRLRDIVSRI